eukprot:s1526_g9.t1
MPDGVDSNTSNFPIDLNSSDFSAWIASQECTDSLERALEMANHKFMEYFNKKTELEKALNERKAKKGGYEKEEQVDQEDTSPKQGVGENIRSIIQQIEQGTIDGIQLSNKHITPYEAISLAKAVEEKMADENKSTIKEINLFGNTIGDEGVKAFSRVIAHENSAVEMLDLGSCGMRDRGAIDLAEALMKNKTMRVLSIRMNHLTKPGIDAIANALNTSVIQNLSLKDCGLSPDAVTLLAKALKTNSALKDIDLSFNKEMGTGVARIAEALKQNKSLEILDLGYCDIDDVIVDEIALMLKENTALKDINLRGNKFTDAGAGRLLQALNESNNQTVKEISCASGNVPELIRAIVDCGFEHPSEVQHECIPQAILGTDVLCQAKSGMGKTAVFVLACLQQVDSSEKAVRTLVICHTRELAYQIKHEFERFAKYFPEIKPAVVYGGTPMSKDKEMLKDSCPHILIGTPGRVLGLVREKDLKLDKIQQFVLDECDKCLDKVDMRKDVQQIFLETPKKKQVMMFSATMSAETRQLCKKFMQDPHEIRVDEESKLTLHGLLQYYVKLTEKEKNRKLNDLLDALEFNQVVIFVKSVQRAVALDKLLVECNFPSIAIHSGLQQEDRIARYKQFKEFQKRIMVSTDLFGRGIDIERVNIVINYDMPDESDSYLHRVGRAGRFGTKGLAITFVATDEDQEVLTKVQERFEVTIGEMPASIDTTSYLNA